jgi:hypothetical protein
MNKIGFMMKVAYSQNIFHFGSNLQKNVPNPNPNPPKERMLMVVIWHFFGEI